MFQHAISNTDYQHPKCECHECTQIRWRLSLQGQITTAMQSSQQHNQDLEKLAEVQKNG